jgi:hypothetical protein
MRHSRHVRMPGSCAAWYTTARERTNAGGLHNCLGVHAQCQVRSSSTAVAISRGRWAPFDGVLRPSGAHAQVSRFDGGPVAPCNYPPLGPTQPRANLAGLI